MSFLDAPRESVEASHAQSGRIHILSLGAGVQSSTMALMAAHGEITSMPHCAIFADTQDEPKAVYQWLDWLEKQLPFPVHRVTAGKLSDSATDVRLSKKSGNTYTKTGLPVFTKSSVTERIIEDETEEGDPIYGRSYQVEKKGIGRRQCTRNFKVEPIHKYFKSLNHDVVCWIGISRDEIHRMKPSQTKRVTNIWPLVEKKITRDGCLRWMEAKGYPQPPRSACVYCPYHSDNEWVRLKTKEPLEFEKAVQFEVRLQRAYSCATALHATPFLHSSMMPLSTIDFDTRIADREARILAKKPLPDDQLQLWGNECEGMCGV